MKRSPNSKSTTAFRTQYSAQEAVHDSSHVSCTWWRHFALPNECKIAFSTEIKLPMHNKTRKASPPTKHMIYTTTSFYPSFIFQEIFTWIQGHMMAQSLVSSSKLSQLFDNFGQPSQANIYLNACNKSIEIVVYSDASQLVVDVVVPSQFSPTNIGSDSFNQITLAL